MNQSMPSSSFKQTRKKKPVLFKQRVIHHSMYFFWGLILLLLPMLFLVDKGNVILSINNYHTPVLDKFFRLFTHLGDGLVFFPLLIVFLFIKYYQSFLLLAMGIGNALLSTILKRAIFGPIPRPKKFFENILDQIYLLPDLSVHSYWSFPSGHTSTAFMIAVFLSLYINKRIWTILLLSYAILVGISRMYLFQHFFVDVYAGAAIGCVSAYCIFYWLESRKLKESKKLNGKLKVTIQHIELQKESQLQDISA
ncbi:phosphatase PAP2 family protein [Sediminitomix flava]|uniref:Membrane-associated phospholipid phosphatase n=1 Tax=Sediminitomix flava TaxID=379075 RepID=A0A315Z9M3_SEDFL|nr:phosphatase PAP2 family protein [Sediminitomix flava]PWJ42265.1 membrane-associated phospholipid phosphatase [Sediminitomix flava]